MVSTTIDFRERNNVERPDMIQLLMEASKGSFDLNTLSKDTLTEE